MQSEMIRRVPVARVAAALLLVASGCAEVVQDNEVAEQKRVSSAQETAAKMTTVIDTGERAAVARLSQVSDRLSISVDEHGHVDALDARRLDSAILADDVSEGAAQAAVMEFVRAHGALYGLTADDAVELVVVSSNRAGSGKRTILQQTYEGHEVEDGRLTAIFDDQGQLRTLRGRVQSPRVLANLVLGRNATLAREAARAYLETGHHATRALRALDLAEDQVLSVRHGGALWRVRATSQTVHALDQELWLRDDGTVIEAFDGVGYDTLDIPIRHYRHQRGEAHNDETQVDLMNVDAERVPLLRCDFSLQRLGSGRARMWNAKSVGTDTTPKFEKTTRRTTCSSGTDFFDFEPDTASDPNWVFNEQQAYYWAQLFKTRLDNWGREPNDYGHYEPNSDRKVNVEIVVNADSSNETDWCGDGVMHGCFSTASKTFFPGIDTALTNVPTVYLFNSAGNASSPQFEGPEHSPTYPIVMHEVGHYVSWTYGNWSAPSNNMRRSLNEGFSMVMPAVFAIDKWETPGYTDSAEVTTGSRIGGVQWTHHVRGTGAQDYSSMDCSSQNPYQLAWPFVQSMWHLANNVDEDGRAIWTSRAAAAHNTADLMMYALATMTADNTMTWKKVAEGLLKHLDNQIEDGNQEGMPANRDPHAMAKAVFDEHGLLDNCNP